MNLYQFQAERFYSPDYADKKYFLLFHVFRLLYELGKNVASRLLLVFIFKTCKS